MKRPPSPHPAFGQLLPDGEKVLIAGQTRTAGRAALEESATVILVELHCLVAFREPLTPGFCWANRTGLMNSMLSETLPRQENLPGDRRYSREQTIISEPVKALRLKHVNK